MKKISFFGLLLAFTVLSVHAQKGSSFGINAGLNFNSNGEIRSELSDLSLSSATQGGFHIGVYGKLGNKIFLRPELLYTQTQSNYDEDADLKISKLDVPVLAGIKLFGLNFFAGPSIQILLNSDIEGQSLLDEAKAFTVGTQLGVGINLGKKLGLDVRYERGMNANEVNLLSGITSISADRLDLRQKQLILNLSLKL
ncbi:MAG: outer membrane beta-barrel protein [Flavobacteriaceae bacterium]